MSFRVKTLRSGRHLGLNAQGRHVWATFVQLRGWSSSRRDVFDGWSGRLCSGGRGREKKEKERRRAARALGRKVLASCSPCGPHSPPAAARHAHGKKMRNGKCKREFTGSGGENTVFSRLSAIRSSPRRPKVRRAQGGRGEGVMRRRRRRRRTRTRTRRNEGWSRHSPNTHNAQCSRTGQSAQRWRGK